MARAEDTAAEDRFFDDSRHVFDLHAAVPDGLRIDDNGWPQFALVQATGGVGADERFEIAPLELLLEGALELFIAVRIAAAPAAAFVALVDADEDVVGEGGHAAIVIGSAAMRKEL